MHRILYSEELNEILSKFVTLLRANTQFWDLYRIVCRSKLDIIIFIWNKGRLMRLPFIEKVGILRSLLTRKLWTDRRSQRQIAREGELYMLTSIGLINKN
jgi:hypothetical protein